MFNYPYNPIHTVKSLSYIFKGLVGISRNKNLSAHIKLYLYYDYVRLCFTALRSFFSRKLGNRNIEKVFYSKAFDYHIHYPIFQSFFFTFNEVFCIETYPALSGLKNYIDLGANIGLSILWFHSFNPKMKIYAFEPDPFAFDYLKRNIQEAKIKNCFLFNKGVSNKARKIKFYRILDSIQNLDSGINLNLKLPFETITISTIKLSGLIKKIKKVSLIKMDIEGEEYNVFKEILQTKSINRVEKIYFESHIFKSVDPISYPKLIKSLKKIGKVKSKKNSKYTSINYWRKT